LVDASNVEFRFSGGLANTTATSSLGGHMSTAATGKISSATPNNFFSTIPLSEVLTGKEYYLCFYVYNAHASELMDDFTFWLSSDTIPPTTQIKWSFDNATYAHKYQYAPWKKFNGSSTKVIIADDSTLDLLKFSICCWFRTTASGADMLLVNKGGDGVDTAGNNMNYCIRMKTGGEVETGFEETDGTNHYIQSPATYNDGLWHFACGTYDNTLGSNNLKLYMDGNTTPVVQASTTTTPETNAHPLALGVNSRTQSDIWYTGDLDEVRVWNVALSSAEMSSLYSAGTVPQTAAMVYEEKFGIDKGFLIAQTIADINTEPSGMDWQEATNAPPTTPNMKSLRPGESQAVWVWWHIDSHASDVADDVSNKDDSGIFNYRFLIPSTGTGSSGGGSSGGGNPIPTTDFTMVACGDWGCKSMTDTIIDLIEEIDPEIVLGLGDNSYDDSSASCWITRFTPVKSGRLFYSCFGNHDVDSSTKKNDLLSFFAMQRTYTSYIYQNVWILVMDTESNFDSGSAQHTFVSDALQDATDNTAIHWKIAIMHRPWVGASSDHSYNDDNIMNTYLPLFDTHKVDLILVGHNHNIQRTYPFKSAGGSSTTKTDTTTGPYTQGVGRIHCVIGTGGHDSGSALYNLGSQPAINAYQNDTDNGVLKITLSNSGQTMTCTIVDESGTTLDSWVISR